MKNAKLFTRTLTLVLTVLLVLSISTMTASAEAVPYPCDNLVVCSYDTEDGPVDSVVHACEKIDGTDTYICQTDETRVYYECSVCGDATANVSVTACDKCKNELVNVAEIRKTLNLVFKIVFTVLIAIAFAISITYAVFAYKLKKKDKEQEQKAMVYLYLATSIMTMFTAIIVAVFLIVKL